MRLRSEELFFDYLTDKFLKSGDVYLTENISNRSLLDKFSEKSDKLSSVSEADLKESLLELWNQGIKHLNFLDGMFLYYIEMVEQVISALRDDGVTFIFSLTTSVKLLIRSQKHLTRLRQLGLRRVTLNLINSNQDVLNRYGFKATASDQYYAIQILQALRFQVHLNYILFEPLTTIDHLLNDYTFLEKNKLVGLYPYSDILMTCLELNPDTPFGEEYHNRKLYIPSADPNLPYQIFDKAAEEVLRWLSFFQFEYGSRWDYLHQLLLELRVKLAKSKPNWVVTNRGQELMYITLDLRRIPYDLFYALINSAREEKIKTITEFEIRRQCEERFNQIESSYWEYRSSNSDQ